MSGVDLSTSVGSVQLANPVCTAAGTAGTGTELDPYVGLSTLGAFVTKSLSARPWAGNPAPRVTETPAGMLNSVGLDNPGIETWLERDLPRLRAAGATTVVSVWGSTVDDYGSVGRALKGVEGVVAVEVNVSCPNIEDRSRMFAHVPDSARAALEAASDCDLPLWAKLSPNVTELGPVVDAVVSAGAEAVTLVNTVMGMVIDVESARPVLGAGGGGLSGPAIRPVAVRAVYETRAAFPELPIVGVGGVSSAESALELILAGAGAIQVGTASFARPDMARVVLAGLARWCERHGVSSITDLIGAAHAD